MKHLMTLKSLYINYSNVHELTTYTDSIIDISLDEVSQCSLTKLLVLLLCYVLSYEFCDEYRNYNYYQCTQNVRLVIRQ